MNHVINCIKCGELVTDKSQYNKEYLLKYECYKHLTCDKCIKEEEDLRMGQIAEQRQTPSRFGMANLIAYKPYSVGLNNKRISFLNEAMRYDI